VRWLRAALHRGALLAEDGPSLRTAKSALADAMKEVQEAEQACRDLLVANSCNPDAVTNEQAAAVKGRLLRARRDAVAAGNAVAVAVLALAPEDPAFQRLLKNSTADLEDAEAAVAEWRGAS
jgi:hypothetical protein